MRLDDREESENVEDRRRLGTPAGIALGGGGILVVIVALLLGVDPRQLQQLIGNPQGQPNAQAGPNAGPDQQGDPEEEAQAHFTKVVFHDTEDIWTDIFQKAGQEYPKPTLVLFTGSVASACGNANSAVGPFYCPGDSKVYIDLGFYRDMQKQLNSPGDFARAYVVAHEVGHHVQKLLGYSKIVDRARASGDPIEEKRMSVRLELQADYLAGVWANHGQEKFNFLEKGDIESALNAALEIGDDRLMKKTKGYVVPEQFTHGTSKQRQRWFAQGLKTGDVNAARALFERPYEEL